MSSELETMFRRLWESACQDAPLRPSCQIVDGHFVLTIKGNRNQWAVMAQAAGVPDHAAEFVNGDSVTFSWPSHADTIFGADGLIAQRLDNYEVRAPQLHMARLVQRAIETNQPAVVEAGTGVGKSYAYAAVAMAMGKKVVISTSNKALQMQLYRKDIPFLQTIYPGKRVAVAVGKTNYACRTKVEDDMAGAYRIGGALLDWYQGTVTGNTEELPFAPNWKELAKITVDDDCTGNICPHYHNCFYYEAKRQRNEADVVITNHALLCLHYLYPNAGLLPGYDLLVVDEAHKLADYMRSAVGAEITFKSIDRAVEGAMEYAETGEVLRLTARFQAELSAYLYGKSDMQIGVGKDDSFEAGQHLAVAVHDLADAVWDEGELPSDKDDVRRMKRANRLRTLADSLIVFSTATPSGYVRWLAQGDALTMACQPFEVGDHISRLLGAAKRAQPVQQAADHTLCTRCGRTLTADKVALLDGKPFGPDCIRKVDLLGDAEVVALSEWLAMEHKPAECNQVTGFAKPAVLCSATLAAPDLSHFLRTCGLSDALQMVAASPFDYEANAVLYAPNGASPAPSSPEWPVWMVEEMRQLVVASGGGAFLLFTSFRSMKDAIARLRSDFERYGLTCYVQGELPKLEIAKRFAANGNAVLFATKSFFEGVSIDGMALRLVVIDKLPFEAPSPLTTAMEAALLEEARAAGMTGRNLEMHPFNALRVPRMIIEVKQGVGRLIRTSSDKGVMAILDSRIRSAQYGRTKVLPALPPAQLARGIEQATMFLRTMRAPAKVKAFHDAMTAVEIVEWPGM